jgi:hypothetical protein
VAIEVGTDGAALLEAIYAVDSVAWLREAPGRPDTAACLGCKNYVPTATALLWRTRADGLPPAVRSISSPHDEYSSQVVARSSRFFADELILPAEREFPMKVTRVRRWFVPPRERCVNWLV